MSMMRKYVVEHELRERRRVLAVIVEVRCRLDAEKVPLVASMIDKLAKRGTIHKNKASNLKSKLARKVNALAK